MPNNLISRVIHSRRVQKAALDSGALEELARPYVAGIFASTALERAELMRSRGLEVSFAYLPQRGSELESPAAYRELLENLADKGIPAELSIKPSQLGLRESERLAHATLRELAGEAEQAGSHITLEMQGFKQYYETLELWRRVRDDHPSLGVTLPVDLRRVESDLRQLSDRPRVRLCIGSYPLPRGLGIAREHDKSRALVRCLRFAVESEATALLASHDPRIIAIMQELGRRNPLSDFEFQMFLGVRPLEQRRLADVGYRSRVLLPYGPGWYEYLLTRVASRPQTAYGYLRAVFDKR